MSRLTAILLCLILTIAITLSSAKDLYKTLELTRNATEDEIKKAFRKLSKKYHPDLNQGNPTAKDKYVEISEANEILSNPEKRQIYDMDGYEAVTNPNHNNAPMDPFAAMFGGRQTGGRPKGPNAMVELQLTLEQLFNGHEVKFSINRNVICPTCRGSGSHDGEMHTCKKCAGKGQVMKLQQFAPGFQVQTQAQCEVCNGRGKVAAHKCEVCHGHRITKQDKELTAVIERGMPPDHKIVFERESEQSPSTTPGDVIAVVKQLPHNRFKREGDDLHIDMIITLKESLLGFSKAILQLDGSQIPVERKTVTQPFEVLVLPDHGMPHHGIPSQRGKLFVRCVIQYPQQLSNEQKVTITELFP